MCSVSADGSNNTSDHPESGSMSSQSIKWKHNQVLLFTCFCFCLQNQLVYVCSAACSQAFKKINNVVGPCEHCKNNKLIHEVKRVDNKICFFCSKGMFGTASLMLLFTCLFFSPLSLQPVYCSFMFICVSSQSASGSSSMI